MKGASPEHRKRTHSSCEERKGGSWNDRERKEPVGGVQAQKKSHAAINRVGLKS